MKSKSTEQLEINASKTLFGFFDFLDKLQNQSAEKIIAEKKFDLDVKYKDQVESHLNPSLVLKQKLTQEDIDEIKRLHVIRLELFDYMRKPEVARDRDLLRHCVQGMEDIEFCMQMAWKFDKDRSKHTWWYQVPNCECPMIDNHDLFGIDRRIINQDCPCHGRVESPGISITEID